MTETKKTDLKWVWIAIVAGVVVSVVLACCAGGLAGYLAYKWAARDAIGSSSWQMLPEIPSLQDELEDEWPFEPQAEPTPFMRVRSGAVLTEIIEGSPAEDAGLRVGDVIFAVDDHKIADDYTLYDAITKLEPGDTITVEVWSHGRTETLDIRLGENPDEEGVAWLGVRFTMMDIPDSMRRSDDDD